MTKSKNVLCKSYFVNSSSSDCHSVKVVSHSSTTTSSIGNCSDSKNPNYGCNRVMGMFISNLIQNPKLQFYKCSNLGVSSFKLFIWDDELECNTSNESKNSVGCTCTEVVQELGCIIKDLKDKKKEKIKLKLENKRKKVNSFKLLLIVSWCLFFAYHKW